MLTQYLINNQHKFNSQSVAEFNFKKYAVKIDEISITGKIDRIDFPQTDKIVVVDYKTGNPDSSATRLSDKNLGDYLIQLVFYKLLIETSGVFKGTVNTGIIEYIEKSKKDSLFVAPEISLTPEVVERVKNLIKETYSNLQNLNFSEINTDLYNKCDMPYLHELTYPL
jgi:hypothetical protein